MATTGTILAKNMKFYVGATALTCQVDFSLNMSTNMFSTTCKDSAANESFLPGSKSWTGSGTGNMAFDATYGFSDLFSAWNNQTTVAMVFQTGVTGDKKYSGTTYVSSLTLNSSGTDEAVTFDFELQGTGALAEATI